MKRRVIENRTVVEYGGKFYMLAARPVPIPQPWHVRLWRWLVP